MSTWQAALFPNDNSTRIRKFLFGSIVFQDYAASAASAYASAGYTPFGAADGSLLGTSPGASGSTGWYDLGYTSTDGAQFSRNVAGDDTLGWQSRSVLRHDITSDTLTVQFTQLETKPSVLALVYNQLFSTMPSLTASAGINIVRPQATTVYRSAIFYGADGVGSQASYAAVLLPYCAVTDVGQTNFAAGSEASYQLTVSAFIDPFMGADSRIYFDGPGWRAQSTTNP